MFIIATLLMVVYDFDFVDVRLAPDKTDSELVVDADAVLALAIAFERFQTIAWRDSQLVKLNNAMKDAELLERCQADICGNSLTLARFPKQSCIRILKALDQDRILTMYVMNVQR
jgi:hypothetical protein